MLQKSIHLVYYSHTLNWRLLETITPPSGADSDREKFLAEHIYRFAALLDGQFSWYFIHKTCR